MTLGQLLKQKRIDSGRTLEQIATHTKIHIKILTAIENDSYAELPARTFTRGFIVNYARALKLNAETLLTEHHDFLESKFGERPNRDQGHQGYAFEGKELEQNRRWMIIGASTATFFALAVLLVFKPQNHKRKEKHKELEEEQAASEMLDATPTPADLLSPSPSASASVAAIVSASPEATATVAAKEAEPIATSTATPAPTTKPKATPKPVAVATPAPTATPAPVESAAADTETAKASPTPKEDKLNKGDSLLPNEVKRKLSLIAKEDVWVRYRSDNLPPNVLILRKGKFLVIKGREKILFETKHPDRLGMRTHSSSYDPFTETKFQVIGAGKIETYAGDELNAVRLPDPASQAQPAASPH